MEKELKLLIYWPKGFSFLGCKTCKHLTINRTCELPQDYPEGYIASDNTGRMCKIGEGCWHYERIN